jgi:hypothetical protein
MPQRRRPREAGLAASRSDSDAQFAVHASLPVFVLGAGVDVVYGLPTVANLLPQLAEFVRGDGSAIDKALRKKLPHLRFTFDRYASGQSDAFLQQLFAGASDIVPRLRSAVDKLKADATYQPIGVAMESLCLMAEQNILTGANVAALAKMAGESGQIGDAEFLLDPGKMGLPPLWLTSGVESFQAA